MKAGYQTILVGLFCPLVSYAAAIYVDDDACPGPGTGTPVDPYCSIQTAINAAVSGVEGEEVVVVADGTYNEIIDFSGKAITVRSVNGAAVTTIDATGVPDPGDGLPVVRCDSGEGPDTVLEGFTITGGTGDSALNGTLALYGGGMFNNRSSPTVMNCVFSGNTADYGGGMYITRSSPTVTHCTFRGNSAFVHGGGINNYRSSLTLTNCTFTGNSAIYSGAGMHNDIGSSTVTNCTFSRNATGTYGGGMMDTNGSVTVSNCIFWGNSRTGGGMDGYAQFHGIGSGTAVFNHCDVQGGLTVPGTGILNTDPLFVDADGADNRVGTDDDDLRLSAGSLCIDAGDNGVVMVATDLDGDARVRNCVVDMGAYEFPQPDPITPADTDCDGDVDGVNFAQFAQCFNKSGNPPRTLGCSPWAADQVDFDDDNDVDGVDFAVFAQCFNKAGNLPRTLGCPAN